MNRSEVQELWSEYFPDVPITEPRWFEECDPRFLTEALDIGANEDKAGRFKVRNQDNIGKYVRKVYLRLKQRAEAAGVNFQVNVTMKFDLYRITDEDKARFQKKLLQAGDCLLFVGGFRPDRYGRFHCNGKSVGSHIFAHFSHHVGHLPAEGELGELQVAHTEECSSRACCNVKHLRLTTMSVNLSERVQGRMKEGQPSKAAGLAGGLVGDVIDVK